MDLLDVMRKRIQEAGIDNIFATMPDGSKYPESITLSFGVPDRKKVYFDGTEVSPLRVTVIVKRVSEYDAMNDALTVERVINNSSLDSEDGSYELTSVETTPPRPIPWDESGRFVWAFDTYIETDNRKEFF